MDPLEIKTLINDEQFNAYMQLGAVQQKKFLESLDSNELINMDLRLNQQFNVPDEEYLKFFGEARRNYESNVRYPTDPAGMSMFDLPQAGSGENALMNEIFSGMRDENFDYGGLPNAKLRAGLSFMDTGKEKESYLTQNVGPEGVGWTMDKYGRYAVMPEFREKLGGTPGEMPLTIDNPGVFESQDFADLAGSSPEIVATIAASIASRNLGLFPAFLASSGAGGAAKSFEELTETALGYQEQDVGEIAGDVVKEGLISGGSEIGGRMLLGTAKAIFSPGEVRVPTGEVNRFNFKEFTYQPKIDAAAGPGQRQTYDLVQELLDEGAIPDVYKSTNNKILGRTSGLIEEVLGYNTTKNVTNVRYMTDRINGFLTDEGLEPFQPFMSKVFPKLNEAELGAMIQAKRDGVLTVAETAAENSFKTLRSAIDEETSNLAKIAGEVPEEMGERFNTSIVNAYQNFRTTTNSLYDEADQLLKGRAIIPTQPIKAAAATILDDLPKVGDRIASGFSDSTVTMLQDILNTTSYISANHMARYRTMFTQGAYDPDMLKGFDVVQFNSLKKGANEAFEIASENGVKGFKYIDASGNTVIGTRNITDPVELQNIKLGLEKLDNAKTVYKDGMELFDNRLIRKLSKQDSVEPDQILSTVISKNSPKKLNTFINATDNPAATKQMLQAGQYDSMVLKATNAKGELSFTSMLNQIKEMGSTFPALYGESAPVLKKALENLNSASAYLPLRDVKSISNALIRSLEEGKPGVFTKEVTEYVNQVKKRNEFLANSFNKKIDSVSPEEIIPWLIKTGNSKDIIAFKKFYGADSAEYVAFKQSYMSNILDSMFVTQKESPVAAFLQGDRLAAFLQKEGQAVKIKEVFGKETAIALEKFAEKASFLTTESSQKAGGFAAANIGLHPIDNIPVIVKLKVFGGILASPKTLRRLTQIIENPTARNTGFTVLNLGTDVISLIENETTIRPEHKKEMLLKLKNGVFNLTNENEYINNTDEDTE